MARTRRWLGNRAFRLEDQGTAGFSRGSKLVLVLFVVALLSGASMAHLKLTSEATTISYHIGELERRKLELQSEKGQLLFEIAEATSLAKLQERARDMGFVPAQDIEYVPVAMQTSAVPTTVPSDRATAERADQLPVQSGRGTAERSIASGWWERFLDQFAAWTTVEPEVTPTRGVRNER